MMNRLMLLWWIHFLKWCSESFLELSVTKTKDVCMLILAVTYHVLSVL